MRAALAIAVGIALAGACAGQVYTSPPPVCFAFNDTATIPAPQNAFPGAPASWIGVFYIHYAAPVTATIDSMEVVLPGSGLANPPGIKFTIYQTQSLGGPVVGGSLGSFSAALPTGLQYAWVSLPHGGLPPTIIAGQTYTLWVQGVPLNSGQLLQLVCVNLAYDPAGAAQLSYQNMPFGGCGTTFPASGTIGLMARFRSLGCAVGPPASVAPIGAACGGPGGASPLLSSTTPPAFGSIWSGTLSSSSIAAPAYLFWSVGVNVTGAPIATGSSCLTYLDTTSLGYLAAIGAEPFASGAMPASGPLVWTGLVPANPALGGTHIAVQALVIDPAGTIPLGGGLNCGVSNGLQLTLGY